MNNPKEKLKKFYDKNGIVETSKMTGLSYDKLITELELSLKTFDDINFETHPMGEGIVGVISFDNGYGASVVQTDFSYGGRLGLYELAVLDNEGHLTYNTSVTDDVIGYLRPEQVTEKLIEIQDLKN